MNRPLVWVAGSFALGIALSDAIWVHDRELAVMFGLIAVGWLGTSVFVRGSSRSFAAVLLCFMAAGAGRYAVVRTRIENDPLRLFLRTHAHEEVTVEGTVEDSSIWTGPNRWSWLIVHVELVTVEDASYSIPGRIVLWPNAVGDIRPGDIVTATGRTVPARTGGHTNYFDRHGIAATISTSGPADFNSVPPYVPLSLRGTVFAVRRHLLRLIRAGLPEKEGAFLAAVWLGERPAMSPETMDTLINTGTYHIACVSGIHMAIVVAVIALLFQSSGFSRRREAVASIGAIALFAVLTGLRLPVCRAAFMFITYYAAHLVRRQGDPLTAASLAALVLLILQPFNLLSAGFQLSFLSVFTIIMMRRHGVYRRWSGLWNLSRTLQYSCLVTAAIFVVTLPIVMSTFGVLSFISPIANVFAIPMMIPILVLAAAATGAGLFLPGSATIIFNNANRLLIDSLLFVLHTLERVPFSHVAVPPPPVWSVLLYYSAVLVLTFPHRSIGRWLGRRRLPLAATIVAVAILAYLLSFYRPQLPIERPWQHGAEMRFTFLDVGQGDATLIEFPHGRTMLVDAGPAGPETDTGRTVIVPYLRGHGIVHLDVVLLTHPHNDHVGGMASVLDTVPVGKVFTTGVPWDIRAYHRFVDTVRARNIPHETLEAGELLRCDDEVTVEALYPTPADIERYGDEPNNTSIVLRLTYKNVSALLTGDIETPVERLLIERGIPLDADILKVPHNGSASSSSPEFLAAVRPRVAVLPVGRNNVFGFPPRRVVRRYRENGIVLLRTDSDGTVIIETDGTNVRWRRAADRRNRPADPVGIPVVPDFVFDT